MKDMVAAVAVGKAGNEICLDLGKIEDNFGQSDMPIALSNRDNKILLLQMDGMLTKEEIEKGIEMASNACKKLHETQSDALRRTYEGSDSEFRM